MPDDTPQPDADAERLAEVREYVAAMPNDETPAGNVLASADVHFLLRLLDSRDAALRERDAELRVWRQAFDTTVDGAVAQMKAKDAEIERLRLELSDIERMRPETVEHIRTLARQEKAAASTPVPPQSDIERAHEAWRPIRERLSGLAKSLQYPIKCLDHVTDERVKPHLLARSEASAALDGIVITEPTWLATALSAARAESERIGDARGYARAVEDAEHAAFRVMSHGTFNQAVIQAIRALSPEPREVTP